MINKQVKLEKLNRDELYRYLGYKSGRSLDDTAIKDGTPDDIVRGIIDKCEQKLFNVVRPAYVCKAFDIREHFQDFAYEGVEFVGTDLVLEGESIRKHLLGCSQAVLMCATLSSEADKLIRRTEIRDMAEALIADTAASVAIEQVCDIAEADIKEHFPEKYMTYRFGVGYGDLPLKHEVMILDILNAGKLIGLYCSETNILTPRKSVVCIVGLSDKPMRKGQKGCATCNMRERCSYRKQGLSCA